MNLSWLSGAAFAGGIAALAALLFALQRLRVRHREVEVVTTLFWREAIEETRARVFVQRFRHPWAYLLVLAIASLVWFAVAGPRLGGANEREHVLVVDASAGMQWGTRFADALNAARKRASELPRADTRIVLAGARLDTLLDRDEELPLFDWRTEERKPDVCPANVQRALFDLAATASSERGLSIEVFGDAPVAKAALALLPKYVEVERADIGEFERKNGYLTALGVTEAASGAWDRVDVFVSLMPWRERDVVNPRLMLDGVELVGDAYALQLVPRQTSEIAFVVRSVPARGGRFDVDIDAAGRLLPGNSASIVLPDRPLIRIALSPKTPAIVRASFGFDSGVTLVADNADVVVRHAGEAFGGEAAAIELVDDETTPAFVVRRSGVVDPEDELRESFEQLGLAEIDSMDLAERAGKRIELTLEIADRPGIALWASLLEERFDFAKSRAFPLFLARSVRWLARVEGIANTCAAGEFAQDGSQRLKLANGVQLDSVGAELRIPRAGEATNERGRAVYASVLDVDASRTPADDGLAVSTKSHGASNGELLPWVVLLAIALLLVEWWLVRAEKIP